ncbi:MAG: RHS repeat-associated core domain-containing protein [Candidatus Acidiferrales bacterium]
MPSYTINSSNEITSNSNASFSYDNNGNTTSKTTSSGTTNYTWDFDNFLASVTLPGTGGTVTFKYDPFGRRIQKAFTQNGTTTTTNYVYDGDNMAEMTDQNGNLVAKYVQGLAVDEPLAESTSGGTDYYEQDGLGSVTSLTGATGSIAQSYTYDSFGNTTNSSGNVTNPFRYTGRDFDFETSLYYYRARYYDSTNGRFISEDPMQFSAGMDFYPYVANSPLSFTDPSGLCQKHPCAPSGSAPPPGFYANLGQDRGNWFVNYNFWTAIGFRPGGFLDAQRDYGGSRGYANYVFGVYMASAGYTLPEALAFANGATAFPTFNHMFPFTRDILGTNRLISTQSTGTT